MSDKMVWVDIETTGLVLHKDVILEVGVILTDSDLNVLDGGSWLIEAGIPITTDQTVVDMHTKSGLWDDHETGPRFSPLVVAKIIKARMDGYGIKPGTEPMCGSTVEFDRKFIEQHMPDLDKLFHYRSINVSSFKELAKKWGYPVYPSNPDKAHRPLQDLAASIAELRFYRDTMLKAPPEKKHLTECMLVMYPGPDAHCTCKDYYPDPAS